MHCTNGLEMAAYAINCRVAIISINCHLLIYETQLLTVIRHNHVYLQLIWMLYVCVCVLAWCARTHSQSLGHASCDRDEFLIEYERRTVEYRKYSHVFRMFAC